MRGRIVGLLLLGVLVGGCASSVETRSGGDLLFSRDVLPVIQQTFAPLLTEDTGLDASSWEGLVAGSDQGEVVIAFDADRSLLIELAERSGLPGEQEIELVRRWIEAGARSDAGAVPYADSDQLLYVCNQGSAVISVIDMEANLVIRTVDLRDHGYSENARPHHVAVEPDGSHWYVSLIGENTVLKFNRQNELVDRISFDVPGMLALDDDRLFVGRSMSAVNPPPRIGMVESGETDIEEIDVFFPRPHALTTNGPYAYSASLGVNQLAVVDATSLRVDIVHVPGPHHSLVQLAISPGGRTMIAGGEMSGRLLVFDLEDPARPNVVNSLDLGGAPWHPSFLPDGSRAIVPRKQADAVSILDATTWAEERVVSGPGLAQPHGSAVRPDGRFVYVSNNNLNGAFTPRYHGDGDPNGSVVVIDAETLRIVKVIEVENYPTGIGTRPSS